MPVVLQIIIEEFKIFNLYQVAEQTPSATGTFLAQRKEHGHATRE